MPFFLFYKSAEIRLLLSALMGFVAPLLYTLAMTNGLRVLYTGLVKQGSKGNLSYV